MRNKYKDSVSLNMVLLEQLQSTTNITDTNHIVITTFNLLTSNRSEYAEGQYTLTCHNKVP
jgi:hypothetical protein